MFVIQQSPLMMTKKNVYADICDITFIIDTKHMLI